MWYPDFEYEIVRKRLEDQRRAAARERLILHLQQTRPRWLRQTVGSVLTWSGRLLIRFGDGLVEPSGMSSVPADASLHR